MKKHIVALTAIAAIGVFSTGVLAFEIPLSLSLSDAYLNVGYNVAGSSELTGLKSYGETERVQSYTGGGGGGLVISAGMDLDITDAIGIKASASLDHMKKTFTNGNSVYWSELQDGSGILEKIPEEYHVDLEVDKWTVSADLLGSYNFVKSIPNLKAGVLAGVNYVSTNAYDMMVPFCEDIYDLIEFRDNTYYYDEYEYSLNCKVDGFGLVAGGFVDYSVNGKIGLGINGYIGLINFGDLAKGFTNFKVSANASYEIHDDLSVNVSFTYANAKFNKNVFYDFDPAVLPEARRRIDQDEPTGYLDTADITYTYKQLVPSIGITYNF